MDWVVVGGESGYDYGKYRYRPCDEMWIYDVVMDCEHYGIPVFVKQLGTHLAKKTRGMDNKGGNFHLFPPELQRREYP